MVVSTAISCVSDRDEREIQINVPIPPSSSHTSTRVSRDCFGGVKFWVGQCRFCCVAYCISELLSYVGDLRLNVEATKAHYVTTRWHIGRAGIMHMNANGELSQRQVR